MPNELFVNELAMICNPGWTQNNPRKALYTVVYWPFGISDSLDRKISSDVEFPSGRVIARLGRDYLDAEVSSDYNRRWKRLHVIMPTGIKREKRLAFLAALYANSRFKYN